MGKLKVRLVYSNLEENFLLNACVLLRSENIDATHDPLLSLALLRDEQRLSDEDINTDTGMATPTEPAQAPPGPITRARARELNFVMILKNEGPEVS